METKLSIAARVKRVKATWLPSADDNVWRNWVKAKPRSRADLIGLISQATVRESIKARALFVLLVPDRTLIPFYWAEHDQPVVGKFTHSDILASTLSPSLQQYVAELVVQFVDMLRPIHDPLPKCECVGMGPGISMYTQTPDRYHVALSFYNAYILNLLPVLPEEQAIALFERFSVLDISSFWNMDDCSGLNPFINLMYSDSLDESWKRKADSQVRAMILAERQGTVKPRQEWEASLPGYSELLSLVMYADRFPYSVELYADQVGFFISPELTGGGHSIRGYLLGRMFAKLVGDPYRELRHRMSRFALFESHDKFSIYDDETAQVAQQMLDEFGEQDGELKQRLGELQLEYEKRQQEAARRQREADEAARADSDAEKKLLEAMQ